jgi:hypothetical protein
MPVVSAMTNVAEEVSRFAFIVIVPVPTFVRVTAPVRVLVVASMGPLADPVIIVLMVAACAHTHASIISAKIATARLIRKIPFTL